MICECCGWDNKSSKRSLPQHKRFFAVLKAYYCHWPEKHEFQPESVSHLRAWLLVKAKHADIQTFDVESMQRFASVKSTGKFTFFAVRGEKLAAFSPRSISFRSCQHAEATRLFNDCEEIFEAETGIKVSQILKEMEAAA